MLRRFDPSLPFGPVHAFDPPATSSQTEEGRSLPFILDLQERSLDGAHFASAVSYLQYRWGTEHRIQFKEVLGTLKFLSTLPKRQQAVGLVEDSALKHRVDQTM